jgi:hypothetical protein
VKQIEHLEKILAECRDVVAGIDRYMDVEEAKIKGILDVYCGIYSEHSEKQVFMDGEKQVFMDGEKQVFMECCAALSGSEINPVLLTAMLFETAYFKDYDPISLAALFSIFCEVRSAEEFPSCEDEFMCGQLNLLNNLVVQQVRIEERYRLIPTSISDTLLPTIVDDVVEWATCENEGQCMATLQQLSVIKGVSVGDFVKALLKISVIARELSIVCEILGQIELKHKLCQIDGLLLKHVATNQSLYL